MAKMELVYFMNNHDNWEEILTSPPYNIKVKRDGKYVLLKYNQLESDFNLELVREARGSIFFYDEFEKKWKCVCHPFDKFGNYGESYVPELDWETACVQEKVDGSLIKVWYHGGWHVSTNGTIDAAKAMISDNSMSYLDLFMSALTPYTDPKYFFEYLDKDYIYMFELVSPLNQMTVKYPETRLYFIGVRNNITRKEEDLYLFWRKHFKNCFKHEILLPAHYPLQTLEDVHNAVAALEEDKEGYVVVDKNFNRAKFKSEAYLIASHLRFNNVITTRKIIDIIRGDQLDDFLTYNPDRQEKVDNILKAGRDLAANLEEQWRRLAARNIATKKDFFQVVSSDPVRDFYLKKYDGKVASAKEWLDNQSMDKIVELIEQALVKYIDL